jgi:drug/metabolite transporter (DMT)-like permease
MLHRVRNGWLFAAAILDAIAALLHLACIVVGPDMYRFMGAGEKMARQAAVDPLQPALASSAIAGVLLIWAGYALSGAGVIRPLPALRLVLLNITAIYLLRAAALPLMLLTMTTRSVSFLVWSSAIVLVYGIVHAIGLIRQSRSGAPSGK